MKHRLIFVLLLALAPFVPVLLAQVVEEPPIVVPPHVSLTLTVLAGLVTFATPLFTGLIKKYGPSIPRWMVPVLAVGIGQGLQWFSTLVPGGGEWSPAIALVYTAIGAWGRTVLLTLTGSDGEAATASAARNL